VNCRVTSSWTQPTWTICPPAAGRKPTGCKQWIFKDPVSGQLLSQAFAALSAQVRTGGHDGHAPAFFREFRLSTGRPMTRAERQFVRINIVPYVVRGDLADSVQLLNEYNYFDGGWIEPWVGLNPQFGHNPSI